MDKPGIKEYSNGEITVVWEPKKCIHAAVCVSTLPDVYKPKRKPWIQLENATTSEIKDQVSQCPSGALTYYKNGEKMESNHTAATKVDIMKNGPLLVSGTLEVKGADGQTETKENVTAFCRCGHSSNKPYCDGAHTKAQFIG